MRTPNITPATRVAAYAWVRTLCMLAACAVLYLYGDDMGAQSLLVLAILAQLELSDARADAREAAKVVTVHYRMAPMVKEVRHADN